MARPGITYFDVAKAAAQLLEQKQRPSIEAVRRILGTGSNSTINQHLREWRKNHGNKIELEQGLPESLLVAVRGIYEALCTEANDKMEKLTSENEAVIAELLSKIKSLEQINNNLLHEKATYEKTVNQSQDEKIALEKLNTNLQKSLDQKVVENTTLSDKINDKDDHIKQLIAQTKQFQLNLDHFRDASREERLLEKRAFESDISMLREEHKMQQKSMRKAEDIITALKQKLEFITDERSKVECKLGDTQNKYHELMVEYQKSDLQKSTLQKHLATISAELQSLKKDDCCKQESIMDFKITTEKMKDQISAYKKALQKAEDKIANLSDKNMFLTQEKAELAGQFKQMLITD